MESYPCFKEARWINSRCDEFKVVAGPAIKAIEEMLYTNPHFIKHVPVPLRPEKVLGLRQAGRRYFENDFKAFESLFTPELMDVLEIRLYKYCLRDYPELADQICAAARGRNNLSTRAGVFLSILAKRMSGDMWTSLGNGFSNLMLALFIADVLGGELDGFVEGDDGLFATNFSLSALDYSDLGFEVEIKELPDPTLGHFCGLTMSGSLEVLKDPRRVLQTFGWTGSFIGAGHQVMDQLLRSKALSLAYELPQCPIIGVLARQALDITEGIEARHDIDWYHRNDHFLEFINRKTLSLPEFAPSVDARNIVACAFGIPVETQVAVEKAIESHDFDLVAQLLPAPSDMQLYSQRYLEYD